MVDAGIFEAYSIRVAEAAKVIENTQRDINIAFMNELAVIFNKMGIPEHRDRRFRTNVTGHSGAS